MVYIDEILINVRSGKYEVKERTPNPQTDTYYMMIELRKQPIGMIDYPLSKHQYEEYQIRRNGDIK